MNLDIIGLDMLIHKLKLFIKNIGGYKNAISINDRYVE